MSNKGRGRAGGVLRRLHASLAYTLSSCLVFQPFLADAQAQQIVIDGRTATTLNTSGAVTDVRTSTISNGNAFNSFSVFDVNAGNTVNLHVPDAASRLVNIVRDKETSVNGLLNTYKNGEIGGDVYFLNPHGVVVGATGTINTGRLTVATPTSEFAEELLNSEGAISHARMDAVVRGDVPLSQSGRVRIDGEVNATEALIIRSATQQITGTVREGAEASRVIFEKVVNTQGLEKGAASVSVDSDGSISLLGAGQEGTATSQTRRKMIVVDTSAATRTETALQIREGLVDITTNTINGNNAYNSFSIFDVFTGQTVNLIVPSSVANLINVVLDKQSNIDGQLNALQNGEIGGNVYFLNPHGVIVGANGIIRADRITIATPTAEAVDALLKSAHAPEQNDALTLANLGGLQKNTKGVVNIAGVVEGKSAVALSGGEVEISGRVSVEGEGAVGIAPQIVVHSAGDTVINGGTIVAEGKNGRKGGTVEVRAGNDVTLAAGSLISVSGRGENSDAGSAVIFAENEATLAADASVLALGGEISGDGGFIEFSGARIVTLAGGLIEAGAFFGKGGEVLIDPAEILIASSTCLGCGGAWSNVLSAGTAFSLLASENITLAENVFLSTRQVGGATDRASHETAASTGDSGSVSLKAPKIELKSGSAIFAQATDGFEAGNVTLEGRIISLDNAMISGADIALLASDENIDRFSLLLQVGVVSSEISITNGSILNASGTLEVSATASSAPADLSVAVNRPYILSSANTAKASVTIRDSLLQAAGDVTVEANAEAVSNADDLLVDSTLGIPLPLDAAIGVSVSSAKVDVSNSRVESTEGDVTIRAESTAEVEATGTARNIMLGGVTLPYAAAISVGVLVNDATVNVEDSMIAAAGDVAVEASAFSENSTSFDVFTGKDGSGALGIGFNYTDHAATARVRNSDIIAGGDVSVQVESLQRATQEGTLEVADGESGGILDLIGNIVEVVVDQFFSEDGEANEDGEKITEYWGIVTDAADGVDTLASAFSDDWGDDSAISGEDESTRKGGVWGATAGALVALNKTAAEVSAGPGRTATITAGGDVTVASQSNAMTMNSVATSVSFEGEEGSATAVAINLSYENVSNRAFIAGDDATGAVTVDAGGASIFAGQFEAVPESDDEDAASFVTFRGEEYSAEDYANGRSIVANARASSGDTPANTYAIGVGVSIREAEAYVDHSALKLAEDGALSIVAQNQLSVLYMESGDNEDVADLAAEAAMGRLTDQLEEIRDARKAAKAAAEAEKAAAESEEEREEAEEKIEAAEADLEKVEEKQADVDDAREKADAEAEAEAGAEEGGEAAAPEVANVGSSYTIGFNFLQQNTRAELRSGASVGQTVDPLSGALSGAIGGIEVTAQSGIEVGGLSTYANMNGGSAEDAGSGTALNLGVNVLLGETVARIAERDGASGSDAANLLAADGDVTVRADNATSFKIVNKSATPDKVSGDATSANLVTLSGGVQMLDTSARLERSVEAGGKLNVEASSANTLATFLSASTAGGETAPASEGASNGLDLLTDIAGYGGEEEEDDEGGSAVGGDDDSSETADRASLGMGAILNIGLVAAAIRESAAMAESAEKAMAAEEEAQGVMAEQGKKDFVLSAGFSFNSFDSVASTADNLTLSANGVTVGAYNDTDVTVTANATSEFEEGAGATVLSVAANLANQDNRALVGSGSTIIVGEEGLTVEASTKVRAEDEDGEAVLVEETSEFFARATGESGLAGNQTIVSLGLNIVDFENEAWVGDNATILSRDAYQAMTQADLEAYLASGADRPQVTVTAAGSAKFGAEGNSAAGADGLFFTAEDGLLAYYEETKALRGAALGLKAAEMATPLIASFIDARARGRQSELTEASEAGGEGNAKGFGIGINVGSLDVHAAIGDGNAILGAGDLSVSADAKFRSSAQGVAGTGSSDEVLSLSAGAADSAQTALDAAAAINVVYGDVSATLGSSRATTVREASVDDGLEVLTSDGYINAGSVSVSARTQAIAEAYSSGKAAGAEAADGVSGAINLHDFDTTATLSGSVRTDGSVSVSAVADTMEIVKADASARGTPVEDYANKLRTSTNNMLVGSDGEEASGSILSRARERFMSNYEAASASSEEFSKAKSSQAFAAALGFNFADHDTTAVVSDNVRIEAQGAIGVLADHDAMSMTEVSGAAVLSDKATGAAISGNVILSTVETRIGNNVALGTADGSAESVSVQAMSRFNMGVNVNDILEHEEDEDGEPSLAEDIPNFMYSSEAIAGAGGKNSSLAGALATTIYVGDTKTTLGDNVSVHTEGDVTIGSYDQSKLANKAWGVSVSLGSGTDPEKSARGAVGSVIYRGREVITSIGNDFTVSAGGDAAIVAQVLTPSQEWVGEESDLEVRSTTWADFVEPLLAGDIAGPLRNADPAVTQSMHNQAIAAAAAGQSTEASFSGSLGLTVANGVTKVEIGERADVTANALDIGASMNQEIIGIGGSLAVSLSGSGGVFGAQAAVTVVLDDVLTEIGGNGSYTATGGDASFTANADTQAMAITAVASISGAGASNTVAANLSVNTFSSEARTELGDNVSVEAQDDVAITSASAIDAFSFAGALGVSFGSSNPIAATLVGNVQLSKAESLLGAGVNVTSQTGNVALAATTAEQLLSVPVAGGGLTGVLSVTVVDSETRAIAHKTSMLTADAGDVSVTAENTSDVLEVAGAIAISMNGTALGLTMPGTGISKTVEAQIGNASARNIEIAARTQNDIRQLAGAGAVSTSGSGVGGTLGVLVIDNEVTARIAEDAEVLANGNIWLDASDESGVLQFGGAVGASTSTGVGASAAAMVVLGETLAEVGSGAHVVARGLKDEAVTVTRIAEAGDAVESERSGIVGMFEQLEETGTAFADNVKSAFNALGDVAGSKSVRDNLLTVETVESEVKGFVMTANGDHRAVAISLALGASTGAAAVGGVVDVGVFSNSVGAHVRNGAMINAGLNAASLGNYGAEQDVLISAQSNASLVGFAGMAGVGSNTGVGGGATVNVFKGATSATVGTGATVKARRDVDVAARRALSMGISNFAMGGGGTAGIGAAVNVSVINGSTVARIDGRADAWRNLALSASETSENIEVIGAIGVGGTAGIGGAVNVVVASSTTSATLGGAGSANAMRETAITAKASETIGNIIVAGGVGGTAGIGASVNVIDSRRGVSAYANGAVNQAAGFSTAGGSQNVTVEADSSIEMFRLVGGLGGGGTVGAGVGFDMATILNQTAAGIGSNALVRAGGKVTVDATSSKDYASATLAGGVGGVVGVGGAVVINRTGYGSINAYEGNSGSSAVDGNSMMAELDATLDKVKGHRIAASGDARLDNTVTQANDATGDALGGNGTSVTALMNQAGYDRTAATIGDGAMVVAGGNIALEANDFSRVYQLAGSVGGGGVLGLGLTVAVNDFSSSAITAIGNNAVVHSDSALSLAAQNISVLEAVNFAGAAGGTVAIAGSINYSRLRNTAEATIGSNANVLASRASISSFNEQNLAATTIGLAGGLVGAGVSFTHAETGGGASVTLGNGATVTTLSGDLDIDATQNARIAVDGIAGAGGAVAGQAAVSEIREDSDAAIIAGSNVTLSAAGELSLAAQNDAWLVSNVVGVAFGAVAAGYVHSYADSLGDASVTIGNAHSLRGSSVSVTASIGELQTVGRLSGAATLATLANDREEVGAALAFLGLARSRYHRAETFGLAAAGGLGAAQGSNLKSATDNDALVNLGSGLISSTSGDVSIGADNVASLSSKIIGLTVGAVSLGVHVARSENRNDSRIDFGSSVDAADDLAIVAATNTAATAESFAISGGLVSIGVSQSRIADYGGATVNLTGFASKLGGSDILARGAIEIGAYNERHFDARLDAFGVGLLGGGSGDTIYDVASTANVNIGNNRKIAAKQEDDESNGEDVTILARNTVAKDLFGGTNLDLKAYGAIAVADVASRIDVRTDTGVTIGNNAEIYSADTMSLKAMTDVSGNDSVNVDAAGAGAFANGKTDFSHTGTNGERARTLMQVGQNAAIFAGEALELSAVTDTFMATSAEGSAYGLGAGMHIDSITSSVSENRVTIGSGADVASYGKVFLGAGEDYVAPGDMDANAGDRLVGYRINTNDVSSKVVSIIGAAIGIPGDNLSRATSDQANNLSVASGASVRSGGSLHAGASDEKRGGAIAYMDTRNYSATSFLNAFMDIKGVGVTKKSGTVNLSGLLETGIDRNRFINIAGSTLGSVTGQGYNWRKAVSKDGDTWVVDYEAPLGDVVLRTGTEHGGLTGAGQIVTPRDADLRVVNASTLDLSVEGLSVPYLVGGKLYVNGTQIKQNGSSLLGAVGYTLPTAESAVSVFNTNAAAPDLIVNGAISNLGGAVTLANLYGSVNVNARVQAGNLSILAGKDFRIDTDEAFNLGNDPIAEFEGLANSHLDTLRRDDANTAVATALPQGPSGSIAAFGDIYIKAASVNINGSIRSGVSGRDTTVTQAMLDQALASNQKSRYEATGSEDDRYFRINEVLGFDPLTATREQLESVSMDDIAEIPLYYDYATGNIIARDLQAEGGTIVIEGRIASTGRGQVEALDGFARFDITNQTAATLELRDIDTGNGVEGSIVFNDYNYQVGGNYLQTRWARNGSDVVKYQNYSNQLTGGLATNVVATGAAAGTYDPLANLRYQWTIEADYYETVRYTGYIEHKEDGEATINDIFDAKGSNPWSSLSFNYIVGKIEGTNEWDGSSTDYLGWSAPVYGADPVGSFVVSSGDTSDFRYVRDVTVTAREVQNFESRTYCEFELAVCMDWMVEPKIDYRAFYHSEQTFSVDAAKTIGINFFGDTTGRIAVDTQGDILIAGAVRNATGETLLTSHQGGIYSGADENAVLIADQLTLNAATGIGRSTADALRIEQAGTSALVNATAPSLYLEETAGNLRLGNLAVDSQKTANGGDLSLKARGNIDLRASNLDTLASAGQIRIESKTGRIVTTNGLNVDTDADNGGTLSVLAGGEGDLTIREVSGDLRVDEVAVAGDLRIEVDGDLINARPETDDLAALDANYAVFLDEKGIGDPTVNASKAQSVDDGVSDQMTRVYHAYWKMRGASQPAPSPLMRGFSFRSFSTTSDYDPAFVYHLSDDDRAAFTANGYSDAQLLAYEEKQTAFYHEANTLLGEAAQAPYDANFAYVTTYEEQVANTRGLDVDVEKVLAAVNAEVVGGNAAPSLADNNIRARGALDVAVTGTIGEQKPEFTVNAAGDPTVSAADMRLMRNAQVGEVIYNADGSISIAERNGVSINADGRVDVSAGENAYLESQGNLNVGTISAGGTLQLKASGDLLNANNDGAANVVANNIIVSSAGENLGTADKRFVTETSDDGFLQLRTGGAAYVEEKTGDMRLADAAGPSLDLQALDGGIIAASSDAGVEINGGNVKLYATGSIGSDDRPLDVTTRLDGALDAVALGGINVYAPDLPLIIANATAGGTSKIVAADDLIVEEDANISAASIDWSSDGELTLGAGTTVTALSGPASLAASGDLTMEHGTTLDGRNNPVSLAAGGDVVFGQIITGRAGDDALSINAGGSVNGNGDGAASITLSDPTALATITAQTGIGNDGPLVTSLSRLLLDNAGGGGIAVRNDRSLALEQAHAGAGSFIDIETDGDLDVGTVSAVDGPISLGVEGDVTLGQITGGHAGDGALTINAGGTVNGSGDGSTNITLTDPAGLASITAVGGIGNGQPLVTSLSRLSLDNTGGGDVVVRNDRDLRIENAQVGPGSAIDIDTQGNLSAGRVVSVDGAITLVADDNIALDAQSLIQSQSGNITMRTRNGNIVQEHGALIDSGLGLVRVHAANSTQLRDVRSTNPSRFAIITISDNFSEDGGNYHRNVLDSGVHGAGVNRSGESFMRLPALADIIWRMRGHGTRYETVINVAASPVTGMWIDRNGTIVLEDEE